MFILSLRTGTKALEGRNASRGCWLATSGNVMNPRVGRRARARHARGGANRRGGEKPRGRNAVRAGSAGPKARRWQHPPAGSGLLRRRRRRGDLWTTPREEVRCESAGQLGPERVGKAGTKVKRVDDCASHDDVVTPGEGPRRSGGPPRERSAHEDHGGRREANIPQLHPGASPAGTNLNPRTPEGNAGGRDRKVGEKAGSAVRLFGVGQRV